MHQLLPFQKKFFLEKEMLPSTLDMEPSTLDPRQKDRLRSTDAAYVQPPRSLIQNRLLRRGTDPRPDFFFRGGGSYGSRSPSIEGKVKRNR